MNYLRGAVSAISVPYYLYKDINPSTLTGAIDVIVIRRPADNGDTELICSPFHVRFGKWQVLRPSEKKVDVTVNGSPIPFSMKIGEAGEAFFVFETDDDVPENLMTSPILRPTTPSDEPNKDVQTDRFGAPKSDEDLAKPKHATSDPDFLDLDAPPQEVQVTLNAPESPKPHKSRPTHKKRPSNLSLSFSSPVTTPAASPSPATTPSRLPKPSPASRSTSNPIDRALNAARAELPEKNVDYRRDVALDDDGYHIHGRETSEQTICGENDSYSGHSTPQASRSPSPGTARPQGAVAFPMFRATSEPPPELDEERDKLAVMTPIQEYSWEWGAFPQPSPMTATFGHNGSSIDSATWSGRRKSRKRVDSSLSRPYGEESNLPESDSSTQIFGTGGKLLPSKSDSTHLIVLIEDKRIEFEVSLVPELESNPRLFNGSDEVYAEQAFNNGRVDYHQLLEDEKLVHDDRLVIRWSSDLYITKKDSSPLTEALILWRQAAYQEKEEGVPTRPTSPMSESELPLIDEPYSEAERTSQDKVSHNRSKSLPPVKVATPAPKPASSSWVQWWRSRSTQNTVPKNDSRPELRETASVPTHSTTASSPPTPNRKSSNESLFVASAPAPSTPTSVTPAIPTITPAVGTRKKFAKTLRLTSDQLKALGLKLGPNTITFALASSGTVACTARIFVWDHSDFVVISDIDGTITKSDALGHVFTMIGRDWTHSGVAKLYTDIVRNGYKIMYLTSRAIGQADSTRDYLKNIKQDHYQLPEGPVIMSPDRLMASLHREVIMRKPEVFKMACLRDIRRLFGEASRNPFYAGFGNRITDALSYRSVDVPSAKIFTIDSAGEVKMELLELAGYKSSYIHMTDLVDQMFPPIHRKWAPEFTDFNYWKTPVQDFTLPDFSPPSPALSARSDTSGQSTLARIRNFSLVGGRNNTHNRQQGTLPPPASQAAKDRNQVVDENTNALRQMSSFERLGSALSNLASASPRSSSPESISSGSESEDDDIEDPHGNHERTRRRSIASMPGSLDDMDYGFGEDEEGEHDVDEINEHDQIADEDELDEDLLAAGEMQNVPFL